MSTEAVEGEPISVDSPINRMRIEDFVKLGFLQEVNRLFLHPLGLALEAIAEVLVDGAVVEGEAADAALVDGTGTVVVQSLGGIWDYRDDPEGMVFGASNTGVRIEKARMVEVERQRHLLHRQRKGWEDGIQPLEVEA